MKKEFLFLTALGISLYPQAKLDAQQTDSLKQVNLEEVIISATRVGKNAPIAFTDMNKQEIKQSNAAKNLPYILQNLPSVVAFSEDGSGVGNTSFRIRGTDATRINITLNGMPLNNPETQEVYWVNLPDLSNSLQNIQVQRGVGSSTNGSGAFGASVSLKTLGASPKPYAEASSSVGSYSTILSTIAAGSGILKNGLSVDARFSKVNGDGYIRNGKVDHRSAYASISYSSENRFIKLNYINGIQHTGITWEGISPEKMAENRRYNLAGEYYDDAGKIQYYGNETDNYYSNVAQLSYAEYINHNLKMNANFSYNNGYGYYENYKTDQKFGSKFGLPNQVVDGTTYKKSDVIRKKGLSNDFYVGNLNLNYTDKHFDIMGGTMLSIFDGEHFGRLKWVKYNQNIPENYEWYRNYASKKELSFFTKGIYTPIKGLSLFADLQYRHILYKMRGLDDDIENINSIHNYSFFNPKAGANYTFNQNQVYASVSVGNREPMRSDLKESIKKEGSQEITPEKMYDYELGYKYASSSMALSANAYYMDYKDQMVQTGKLNDVGYKLMENVPKSYRLGLELSGAYQLFKQLNMAANISFSRNKIKDYTAYYDLYDNQNDWNFIGQVAEYKKSTDISFSPNVVSSIVATITPYKALSVILSGKYVGKQYYDNSSDENKRLAAYFVTNIVVGYSFKTRKTGEIDVQFYVNNVLNKEYVANAWTATDKFEDNSQLVYTGLYPQATRNIMARIGIKF